MAVGPAVGGLSAEAGGPATKKAATAGTRRRMGATVSISVLSPGSDRRTVRRKEAAHETKLGWTSALDDFPDLPSRRGRTDPRRRRRGPRGPAEPHGGGRIR